MKILYFAEIKEIIGKSEELISIKHDKSINELILDLKSKNIAYKKAFESTKNLKCAVNSIYAESFDNIIKNTDEIAFFPPVTGG